MVVAYTNETSLNNGHVVEPISIVHMRNTTISVGCSCVLRQTDRLAGFLHSVVNKRAEMPPPPTAD
jgi:hypothetical protein